MNSALRVENDLDSEPDVILSDDLLTQGGVCNPNPSRVELPARFCDADFILDSLHSFANLYAQQGSGIHIQRQIEELGQPAWGNHFYSYNLRGPR